MNIWQFSAVTNYLSKTDPKMSNGKLVTCTINNTYVGKIETFFFKKNREKVSNPHLQI
jgi:hypothetical protein